MGGRAVSGEVVDGLTTVSPPDLTLWRGRLLVGIVAAIVESVTWRCADTVDAEERDSLRRLVEEVEAHRHRMLSSPHAR